MTLQHPLLKVFMLSSVLGLSACETVQTTQRGVVGVQRPQRMAWSSATINQSAQAEYVQLVNAERQKGTLNHNPTQAARVRAIVDRLVVQTPVFRPDALSWKWEVNVVTTSEVNAWCMPGGKIAVYTGLIDKLQLNDDELAAVMGHEMAHALREHARERASGQAVANLGISVLSAAIGVGNPGQKGMEYTYMAMLGLPNSRSHETEADRIGVELAARAGYNPKAAMTLWRKMEQLGRSEPPEFLSTHPAHDDRFRDLTDYSQRVESLYKQAANSR